MNGAMGSEAPCAGGEEASTAKVVTESQSHKVAVTESKSVESNVGACLFAFSCAPRARPFRITHAQLERTQISIAAASIWSGLLMMRRISARASLV